MIFAEYNDDGSSSDLNALSLRRVSNIFVHSTFYCICSTSYVWSKDDLGADIMSERFSSLIHVL